MELIDNKNKTLLDDLSVEIKKHSKISIAAACFSIYAFQELKEQLTDIEELRFIFTAPTFIAEKTEKEKREFYIPRLSREKSIYGSEFEVKLRNELTQKAVARECAEWIKKKAFFKSNVTNENMMGFINVGDKNYMPISGFTTVDLGCERGNNAYTMVQKTEAPFSAAYIELFDSLWNDKRRMQTVTEEVIDNISAAYGENSPEFVYFIALFNIFNEFLEDISEDVLPNEATGFKESKIWEMLYDFQRDAALAIINKLEKYNGCILADSVGLGKTFTALAVVKYYENKNRSVLVLCPKKLSDNWNTYKSNYLNNPLAKDRLRYDVLYHTDLSRNRGKSNGLDLSMLNWGNYDLIIIDESHNFRNGGEVSDYDKENRYQRLMNKVIRAGVKTKVLMLSATPVNNRFNDLKSQLALAYEGDASNINEKLDTKRPIDEIFKSAQKAFNSWNKSSSGHTTEDLLSRLDFDFFELLDSVTIARSRKHIAKYYDMAEIGKFPERLKPVSLRPGLTRLAGAVTYNQIYARLSELNLSIYTPSDFIHASRMYKYQTIADDTDINLTISGRECGILRLMRINLLKRLESSVFSFRLTVERIMTLLRKTIEEIDEYERHGNVAPLELTTMDAAGLDGEELDNDTFAYGGKVRVDICDMDYTSWKRVLSKDLEILSGLAAETSEITPQHDLKLQTLLAAIDDKIERPINDGNKKILIFTAFADTAQYLYENVSRYVKKKYNINAAMITGSVDGRTTIPKLNADFNTVLTCFSPLSKEKRLLMPNDDSAIDILIATDCISEGQNLQDCDYLINYDIHWNPVRIIQRFGRIDRIGSRNKYIQLVNFWPDMTLDDYIDLKARVETRMKISVMTATGDDNPLSAEEQGDLEYRRQQLERLQNEIVDIEEISGGVSIMDLGLNEFRLDLLEYVKTNPDLDKAPFGLNAIVPACDGAPAGVIYILKNRSDGVNINSQNLLHPFYIVYISENGTVVCDHLSPKQTLDKMRWLCRGVKEPLMELCRRFNRETKDGRNMRKYSKLLGDAIASIIEVKDESDLNSFLSGRKVSFTSDEIKGLDDFELICFLIVQ